MGYWENVIPTVSLFRFSPASFLAFMYGGLEVLVKWVFATDRLDDATVVCVLLSRRCFDWSGRSTQFAPLVQRGVHPLTCYPRIGYGKAIVHVRFDVI